MRALYGRVLRRARQDREMTQAVLAEFLGMGQGNLSDIERGKINGAEPTKELAGFLGADFDHLLAAWKMSGILRYELQNEDRAGRRLLFHEVAKRDGIGITLEEFDQMMVDHVDPNHMKGERT